MAIFVKDIDYSNFSKHIDPHKAIEFVFLIMEALGEKYMQQYRGKEDQIIKDLPFISKELEEYVMMLKYGMYENK